MKSPLLSFEIKSVDSRDKNIYYVYNHEKEFLGTIVNSRVGRFFHWIFSPTEQTYYTNGCLKEIVEFITKLYSNKNATTNNN